jgi:mRNA deadenylase 3'-5' endonuclease subunit Ccr4
MTSLSITVMTLNLHEGERPSESPNTWEKRRDICVSVITSYSPTILCTQQGERRFS